LGARAAPPPPAATQAGDAMAKSVSPRDDAARVDRAVEHASSGGLLAAVKKGDIEAARTSLQTTAADAERDADGRTALAVAVLRADLPLVKLLLASGADRHAVDRFGHTPATYAHASGDTKLLQVFGRP
jgi:ankyrin repeat protein